MGGIPDFKFIHTLSEKSLLKSSAAFRVAVTYTPAIPTAGVEVVFRYKLFAVQNLSRENIQSVPCRDHVPFPFSSFAFPLNG